MDAYIGEIRVMGFNYNPIDWLLCDGATFNINQYQALFAVIGYNFGGDNVRHTFNVPNLQGLLPVGMGTGKGLTTRLIGENVGDPNYTLTPSSMPSHNHKVEAYVAGPGTQTTPVANVPALTGAGSRVSNTLFKYVSNFPSPTNFNLNSIGYTGTTTPQPVPVLQPSLAMCFCICYNGYYPPRP